MEPMRRGADTHDEGGRLLVYDARSQETRRVTSRGTVVLPMN
jgi:hypothetical protein